MSRHSFSAYDSAMLSDEGDLYSDEEDGTVYGGDLRNSNGDKIIPTAADRRAHHNALERKRRDHIKDSFTSLRDSVPSLQGEKVTVSQASRAQILKKAAEYIQFMRKKNNNVQSDIDEIAKQNKMLEDQIRRMEKAKNGGGGSVGSGGLSSLHLAGSSGSSSSAAASSVGNGVGGGGGGGSPLLYTEQIEVSTSYDTSEQDSNGSCSNSNGPMIIQQQPMQPMQHGKPAKIGAGGSGSFSGAGISIISAASILEGGSGSSSSSSPSSSSSNSSPFSTLSPSPVTATYSAGPSSSSLKSGGTVLINGGGGSTNGTTLRPVMHLAKNGSLTAMGGGGGGGSGTSKIIVQNPQHKNGGQPHVIHVTTSPAASAMLANGVGLGGLGGLGVGGGNITAMSSSGKPIIITSAQLSAAAANGTLTVINGQNGKCK